MGWFVHRVGSFIVHSSNGRGDETQASLSCNRRLPRSRHLIPFCRVRKKPLRIVRGGNSDAGSQKIQPLLQTAPPTASATTTRIPHQEIVTRQQKRLPIRIDSVNRITISNATTTITRRSCPCRATKTRWPQYVALNECTMFVPVIRDLGG